MKKVLPPAFAGGFFLFWEMCYRFLYHKALCAGYTMATKTQEVPIWENIPLRNI